MTRCMLVLMGRWTEDQVREEIASNEHLIQQLQTVLDRPLTVIPPFT